MNDYEMMMVGALRYALPRMSYIVGTTIDYLTSEIKQKKLSKRCRDVMVRDIQEHLKERRNGSRVGINHDDWKELEHLLSDQKGEGGE